MCFFEVNILSTVVQRYGCQVKEADWRMVYVYIKLIRYTVFWEEYRICHRSLHSTMKMGARYEVNIEANEKILPKSLQCFDTICKMVSWLWQSSVTPAPVHTPDSVGAILSSLSCKQLHPNDGFD